MDDVDGAIVQLADWAAAARADDAADSRIRQMWAQVQAEDEATMAGVLAGLVERRAPLAIHLRTGTTLRGVAVGLGSDYVALAHAGQLSLVAAAAVEWARPDGVAAPAVFADRAPPTGSLAGVLAGVAAERLAVRVLTTTEALVGELVAVGADVLTVRPAGAAGDHLVYVATASVAEVAVRLS